MNYQLFNSQGLNRIIYPCFKFAFRSNKPSVFRGMEIVNQLRQTIAETRGEYAQSTCENYITAVNSLEKFLCQTMPCQLLTPYTITSGHVKAFELWMLDSGLKPNYVSQQMRSLRALINRINNRGKELFARVRTTPYPTAKRAVDEVTIHKIASLKLPRFSRLAFARDIFIFCFLCMGIPLIDAVYLKKSQIKDKIITYYRHKTHRMVNINITDELLEITNHLHHTNSDYLLPVLKGNDERMHMQQYRHFYQRYMRSLRKLSSMMELDTNITSYTPRHTWASIAFKKGIDINTISQALAHSNTTITNVYIKEICNEQLMEANKIVISAIKTPN